MALSRRMLCSIAACLAAVAALTVSSRAFAGTKGESPQANKAGQETNSPPSLISALETLPFSQVDASVLALPTSVVQNDGPQPHGPGACATPQVIYRNDIGVGNYIDIPGSGPDGGYFAADDIVLVGEARLLCSYTVNVFNPTTTANIEVEWFTACPAPHLTPAGAPVPGTLATFTVPVNAAFQPLTFTPPTPVVLAQNSYFVRFRNVGTTACGWAINLEAEVGTTANNLAAFVPGFDSCTLWFGGAPYAGMGITVNAATGPGACCLASGTCVSGPDATQCVAAGGSYQGDGSDCSTANCVGACCLVGVGCDQQTGPNCISAGGVFKGLGVSCAAAGCTAECATSGTRCYLRDNVNARTSNRTTFNCAEDFVPAAGSTSVNQVCVWGVYAAPNPLPVSSFRVRYFDSVNGIPGNVLATFTEGTNLTVSGPSPTGSVLGGGALIYNWNMTHAPVAVTPGQCHWVEVTNATTSNWFWATSADGNSYFMQDATPADAYALANVVGTVGINLAYCLNNAGNNFNIDNANPAQCVSGACILNTCPFTCIDGVTESQCTAAGIAAGGSASFIAITACVATGAQPVVCCRADMDGNGLYNGRDIQAFARAIRDWTASGDCQGNDVAFCRANVNEDFKLDVLDVAPFVTILLNSGETNDRCCGAPSVALTAGVPSVIVMDNTNATTNLSDPGFSCGTPPGSRMTGEVFVKFVAPAASIFVSTAGNVAPADDSLIQVLAGQCGQFVALGCDDDSGGGFLSQICVSGLNIGETYYIGLASFAAADRGAYNVTLESPCPTGSCCVGNVCSVTSASDCRTNGGVYIAGGNCGGATTCPNAANVAPGVAQDTCATASATPIACGQVHTTGVAGLTSTSVPEGTNPASTCEIANGGPFGHTADWYYTFTPPAGTTRAALIMCGLTDASQDTILTVWGPNSGCATFPQVACDDDDCTAPAFGPSRTTGFDVTAGSTYIIRVQLYTTATPTTYTVGVMCQQ